MTGARPRPRSGGHGWWPYWIPYVGFLGLVQVAEWMPHDWSPYMLSLKVALPAGFLVYFFARGAFPELRKYRPTPSQLAGDVAVGLLVTVLWMAPFLLFESLRPDPGEAFDPDGMGESLRSVTLGLRFLGFAAVTPFMEELFVRSWLLRFLVVIDTRGDFRNVPVGTFTWLSFLVTVGWFTFTHVSWEWGVAAATGVVYNLWLYRRRQIGAVVVSHGVTNASLFLAAWLGSGWLTDADGNPVSLLFFL